MRKILFIISMTCLLASANAWAERVKDIATIAGVRSNPLIGYGLVVGLDGTGDDVTQSTFTLQSFKSMLAQLGIVLPAGANPSVKNIAAVVVSADLPPFVKPGQRIDVTVSSIGNAKSLRGGSLLMAPLKGADGVVYAMAQGSLVVGGFGASGSDGSKITVNVPSVGQIPNGASVERAVITPFSIGDHVIFNLKHPDFTTSKRLADAINIMAGPNTAKPMDAASIFVKAPESQDERVNFISVVENIPLTPGEGPAKIVVNSRSGTIVIGQHVKVRPAAVAHGNLTVTITEDPIVSQPNALSTTGTTAIVPTSDVSVTQEKSRMFLLNPGTSLQDIVRAVNSVGAAPGDLMAILQALKQAGALEAELEAI